MRNRNKKGFTLVELVIVIAVIAILAGVMIGTFAGVISRAQQSAKVQEWKAAVDAAYVDYVADEHEVPGFIKVDGTTVEFKKATDTGITALGVETYALDGSDPAQAYKNATLNTFVILDEANKVYFIWNTDGTYAVVATNNALTQTTLDTGFTDGGVSADTLTQTTVKTLTYNSVVYYGPAV